MSKYVIRPNGPLKGRVKIDGAKNAALPILAATLMTSGEFTLEYVPNISDIHVMTQILNSIGVETEHHEDKVSLLVPEQTKTEIPYCLAKNIRASNLFLGALLVRNKKVSVPLPGGCNIGSRPMDLHLKGFQAMGAEVSLSQGSVVVERGNLVGAKIYLDFPSVGATENIMMAACAAEGQTVIENAAKEPEIVDLANFLNAMGAKVIGAGTDLIKIKGFAEFNPVNYAVIPDRIEAGTFMIAAAITRGEVILENVISTHLQPLIAKLTEMGVEIIEEEGSLKVIGKDSVMSTIVKTLPYPGFPTDLQSPMMALLSLAGGTSTIVENVFENRLSLADELKRMGASITIEGHTAIIEGVSGLKGAAVRALDLRAGAALILAGLIAEGKTEILEANHIERGYYGIDEKLNKLGAIVEKLKE